MLSVVMLSVVKLSVVILSVMVLSKFPSLGLYSKTFYSHKKIHQF